jgi:hypothetical protein
VETSGELSSQAKILSYLHFPSPATAWASNDKWKMENGKWKAIMPRNSSAGA